MAESSMASPSKNTDLSIRTLILKWREERAPQLSEYRRSLYMLTQNKLSFVGILIVGALLLVAASSVLVPENTVYSVNLNDKFLAPSAQHFFGTDSAGRDIFSRVVYGCRISLFVGLLVPLVAMAIGIPLGLISGFMGQKVDEIIMRATDAFLSFPSLLLALAASFALGRGIVNAMLAISITWWPWYTRLVRSRTLTIREEAFVKSARAMGAGKTWITIHHIFPHCIPVILVQASMDVGYAILAGATLGFLGVGAQEPMPEWGLMVSIGRYYFMGSPWGSLFPGIFIFIAVLGFNLLGDGVRDLFDPRLRRVR